MDVMNALSDKAKRELYLTCLFGAFVFLQFTVLGLANHAGEGYLATEQRSMVYYALQVFVIGGFLLYSLYYRLSAGGRGRNAAMYGVFGAFLACVAAMLIAGHDSLGYVAVSMAAALCIGGIGGAIHIRMSLATVTGASVARCMGIGSAVAVVLQYLLQIQWGPTLPLPAFMLAGVVVLFLLAREAPAEEPEAGEAEGAKPKPTTTRQPRNAGKIRATRWLR